jgi:hypothetical protein
MKKGTQSLNYFLLNKQRTVAPITLDLFEAERYDAAVIVQQLIGNLVYYSNQGRYEPRIAESWRRLSPRNWIFNLKDNFKCENGEVINALNFKKSLEKSIFTLGKKGNLPVFSKLVGFQKFLSNFEIGLEGINVHNNSLTFNFEEPVRSGLIQLLSFAPFGYICSENLKPDGTWKDNQKFISSGAYKVKEAIIGKKYVIEKREEWPIKKENSPKLIHLSHDLADTENPNLPAIIDSFTNVELIPEGYEHFPLVPEYLNVILLGNLKKGFFSDRNNRLALREAIDINRSLSPQKWQNHIQTKTFYPTANDNNSNSDSKSTKLTSFVQADDLIIEGKPPQINTARWLSWQILEGALKSLNLKYKFANNESSWAEMGNQSYDIRIRAPSVGGGIEAWGLDVVFCSPIGSRLPDPSGGVCKLISDYENDIIDEKVLSDQFLKIIDIDSAVIPISRFGMQWYVSGGFKKDSLSPLISVIRFDDLEMD